MGLDVMRKHSRSFIIYILFGIIIAVFIINFGPQSQGCTAGVGYAGKVVGNRVTPKELAYAFSVTGILTRQVPEPQLVMLKGRVLDQLIFREILAEEALKLGFHIPEKEINDMLVKGRYLALGQPRPLIQDDDGKFDYSLFSRYVRYNWGLTVKKFKRHQRRELLAEKFRNVFRSSIEVAESEAKARFTQENTKVELDYVHFSPVEFRRQVEIDDAKVKAYIAKNKTKVKEYFEENKTAYEKLPKQIRIQAIQINAPEADAAPRAAGEKKAKAALARIKGGEAFGKVAAEVSDDEASKRTAGIVGWRNEDSPGLWEAASKEAADLKKDETSAVIADKEGFTIVRVLGRREGTLTLAQAQGEIAEEMLREAEAVRLAREAAEGYLARAKAGEKLEDIFTAGDADDADDATDKAEGGAGADEAKQRSPLKVASTASFSRNSRDLVPGIGISAKLMNDVFALEKGKVAPGVYTVDDNVYLVAVKDRTDPDWSDWKKRQHDIIEEYQAQKYVEALSSYAFKKCENAYRNKEIAFNPGVLLTPGYTPPKGEPPLPQYVPCSSLKPEPLM